MCFLLSSSSLRYDIIIDRTIAAQRESDVLSLAQLCPCCESFTHSLCTNDVFLAKMFHTELEISLLTPDDPNTCTLFIPKSPMPLRKKICVLKLHGAVKAAWCRNGQLISVALALCMLCAIDN